MEPNVDDEFPTMPTSSGRSQTLEGSASTVWTLLFFAYSSSTFISEFGEGWAASWSVVLVLLPVILAGTANILDRRPKAVPVLLTYVAYVIVPTIIQLCKPNDQVSLQSEISDLATVLVIWLPLELKLLSPDLSPTGKVKVWSLLTAALNIANIFTILHPSPSTSTSAISAFASINRPLGYSYKLTLFDLATAVAFAVMCLAAVIPVAVMTGFGKLRRNFLTFRQKAGQEVATLLGMYMSAVTEELLFRGLIHNMIEQRTAPKSVIPLIASSIAYAVAHISKKKLNFRPPNMRFAACASVSGVFYGIVWQLTSKVTASAVTHALVDFGMYRIFLVEPLKA